MNRKRTQAEKSRQVEKDEDAPPKRSRPAQNKVFQNVFHVYVFMLVKLKILKICELNCPFS